jgi:hypothetical protein
MHKVLFVFYTRVGKQQMLYSCVLFVLLQGVFLEVLLEVKITNVCAYWFALKVILMIM